jgi:hypothetical protein
MGNNKKINWQNPKDLNEKINYLKFYSDTTQWSILADKYLVRDFVRNRVGDDCLVSLYGMWKRVEDIDFSLLPNSFVLKSNNGAGSVLIVRDKNDMSIPSTKIMLQKWLKKRFGRLQAEPHYLKITPCIIAEQMLNESCSVSSSLVDYKIWCFDGNVFGTWCCFNRDGFHADTEWHDLEWHFRPEWSNFTKSYRNGGGIIPKPKNYEKMLLIASELSKGFPQVRVDLYNIDGHIYFGEMTFTSLGALMDFHTDEFQEMCGNLIDVNYKR